MKTLLNSKKAPLLAVCLTCLLAAGCGRVASDADVASDNVSKAATMFEVDRRIVFFNSIADTYLLSIEGRCAIEHGRGQISVTCKSGQSSFKKHFLGLSDNVTYFVEQLEPIQASAYHYRVIFKPQVIIPDIDLQTSLGG